MHEAGAVEQHVDRAQLGGQVEDGPRVQHVQATGLAAVSWASRASLTSVAITRAPSRANSSALALPMPWAAAVTRAVLPESLPISMAL
jgi:hypothetical protein